MSQEEAADAFQDALAEDDPVQLYERAPCGYLSTTPDGRIIKANETFLTWTGFTFEELRSRTFADLLTVGGRIFHETHYAPMLRMQGTVREIAVDVRRQDGSRLPVLVNATLDRFEDGTPRVVRIALFDATERRGYERELVAAKERAESSEAHARTLARTLQQTLIPPLPPHIPGLDVAAAYRPAGDGSVVGGDFYDVFALPDGEWVVVLGDVCGKGVDAAVVTALARYSLRALAPAPMPLRDVLSHLNETVLAHETDRFCTVLLARLRPDADGWRVTLTTGGHPPAVLLRPDAAPARVELVGPLVGAFDHAVYPEHELVLRSGEALVLYTDGVTEAQGAESWYGEDRLLDTLGGLFPASSDHLVPGLVEHVLDFQGGVARDDIAVLAVRVP